MSFTIHQTLPLLSVVYPPQNLF